MLVISNKHETSSQPNTLLCKICNCPTTICTACYFDLLLTVSYFKVTRQSTYKFILCITNSLNCLRGCVQGVIYSNSLLCVNELYSLITWVCSALWVERVDLLISFSNICSLVVILLGGCYVELICGWIIQKSFNDKCTLLEFCLPISIGTGSHCLPWQDHDIL